MVVSYQSKFEQEAPIVGSGEKLQQDMFLDVIWYKFYGKLAYGHDAAQQFVHNGQTTFYMD
jgi:hypothetical protein